VSIFDRQQEISGWSLNTGMHASMWSIKSTTRSAASPDHHELPTPRTTCAPAMFGCWCGCKSCRHRRDADLQALVDAGRGDVPLSHLRFRCSSLTDFVVTSTEPTGRPR
jgi:hypothetical protein